MANRVEISGIGVVSPYGVGRERFWTGISRGCSATRAITAFDATPFPCQVAAPIPPGLSIDDATPLAARPGSSNGHGRPDPKRYSRASLIAVLAATEAWADAGLRLDGERGVVDGAHDVAGHHDDGKGELGRQIDYDHYGAGFSYRFGSWEEPAVQRSVQAFRARAGANVDPRSYLAIGGAQEIIDLVEVFRAVGVSKFVLRPIVSGDADMLEQTRLLDAEVIPYVHSL